MENYAETYLNNLTPPELLSFYENFIKKVKQSPKKYGGNKNLRDALLKLKDLDPQQFSGSETNVVYNYPLVERNNIILISSPDGFLNNKSKKREDVKSLYRKYESECQPQDKGKIHECVVQKAKHFLIHLMIRMSIAWKYTFNPELHEFEYTPGGTAIRKITFTFYYWYENNKNTQKVNKGYLDLQYKLSPHGIFDFEHATMKLLSDKEAGRVQYILQSERIVPADGVLFIYLKDTAFPIYSHLVFYVGRDSPDQWNMLVGTYSTIGRRDKDLPIAGVIILEQMIPVDNLDGSEKKQLSEHILAPEIHSYLYRSKMKGIREIVNDSHELPSYREIELLKKYVGAYQGIYFRKAKNKLVLGDDNIEKFFFQIFSTGDAEICLPGLDLNTPDTYQGRVRVIQSKNDALIGYFDYLPNNKAHRFTIYFNKEFKGDKQDEIFAVYAGIERHDPFVPVAGRMNFRRLERLPNYDCQKYISRQKLEDFQDEPGASYYVDLFSGNSDDDYVETINRLEEDSNAFQNESIIKFAGFYFVYFLSTSQDKIYKIPLEIQPNGTVAMKTRDPKSTNIHTGKAHYNGSNRLSIYMQKEMHDQSYFHFLFYTANQFYGELIHLFGVGNKFDEEGRPSAMVTILVKDSEIDLKYPTVIYKLNNLDDFSKDEKTTKLLSYLTGKENRYITSKRTPNAELKRKGDYADLYFNAACHLCASGRHEQGLQYLYQAYLHGFGNQEQDVKYLQDEDNTSFKNIKDKTFATRPKYSKLPTLNYAELFELINARYKKA